jgi:hypothetical protein
MLSGNDFAVFDEKDCNLVFRVFKEELFKDNPDTEILELVNKLRVLPFVRFEK